MKFQNQLVALCFIGMIFSASAVSTSQMAAATLSHLKYDSLMDHNTQGDTCDFSKLQKMSSKDDLGGTLSSLTGYKFSSKLTDNLTKVAEDYLQGDQDAKSQKVLFTAVIDALKEVAKGSSSKGMCTGKLDTTNLNKLQKLVDSFDDGKSKSDSSIKDSGIKKVLGQLESVLPKDSELRFQSLLRFGPGNQCATDIFHVLLTITFGLMLLMFNMFVLNSHPAMSVTGSVVTPMFGKWGAPLVAKLCTKCYKKCTKCKCCKKNQCKIEPRRDNEDEERKDPEGGNGGISS